ncbi:MAG: hypothetical protein R2715_11030 [Ilumatobacteraceae bacterium]
MDDSTNESHEQRADSGAGAGTETAPAEPLGPPEPEGFEAGDGIDGDPSVATARKRRRGSRGGRRRKKPAGAETGDDGFEFDDEDSDEPVDREPADQTGEAPDQNGDAADESGDAAGGGAVKRPAKQAAARKKAAPRKAAAPRAPPPSGNPPTAPMRRPRGRDLRTATSRQRRPRQACRISPTSPSCPIG